MTSRDRVMRVLSGQPPDRVPLNVFAGWNPGIRKRIEERHGSIPDFDARFGIDIVTGVLPRFPFGRLEPDDPKPEIKEFLDRAIVLEAGDAIVDEQCDGDLFLTVSEAVAEAAGERAVFAHAWGVFELSQFLFERGGMPGTEDALINTALEKDTCREVYLRLAEWTADCAVAAIKAGADCIELSDDWGQQRTMLFSPESWWELVYPATKLIVDRVRSLGIPVVIHSDGDISEVLDGIRALSIEGLHPVQESAGMDARHVREKLGPKICIMGGLDTVSALPRMNVEEIQNEVERVFGMLKETGGFIFAGSHMFQDDNDPAVIEAAYERAMALSPLPDDRHPAESG